MEADTAIWLVKKLKNSWSAHTVSDQLTDAALEDIKVARGTLGTPVLMRTLLALLSLKEEQVADRTLSIKALLTACGTKDSHNKEEWVHVVSGLVHRKLYHTGDDRIEAEAEKHLHSALEDVVTRGSSSNTDDQQAQNSEEGEGAFYFQPQALRFLTSTPPDEILPASTHFTSRVQPPDFLAREKKLHSEKLAAAAHQAPAIAERTQNRPILRPPPSLPPGGVLRAPKITAAPQTTRHKVRVLGVMELAEMEQKRSQAKDTAVFNPKAAKDEAAKDKSSAGSNKRKRTSVGKPDANSSKAPKSRPRAKVAEPIPTTAALDHTSTAAATAVVAATAATGPAAAGTSTGALAAVATSAVLANSRLSPPTRNLKDVATSLLPVKTSALAAPTMNLKELFENSPLMSDEDKGHVKAFFAHESFVPLDPQAQKRKIKLSEETLTDAQGKPYREAMYLSLDYATHTWQKTKKTKRGKGVGADKD